VTKNFQSPNLASEGDGKLVIKFFEYCPKKIGNDQIFLSNNKKKEKVVGSMAIINLTNKVFWATPNFFQQIDKIQSTIMVIKNWLLLS